MDLREYEQTKFAIAEILRAATNTVPPEESELRERLHELVVRLAEDRFHLVVVGRFNRGKTSIMNAILGASRLPVGIVPLTSVITTVSYGAEELAVLRFAGSRLSSDIPLAALPEYVTQKGNPGNFRGVRVAEVKLRAEILRRGFYFVDTPGLGSAIIENTATTQAFLPEADAFLLVTSYDSPVTEEEMVFLRTVSASRRRVFVVVNKQDTVTADERDTVLEYIRDRLRPIFGEDLPRLFSVSANEALDAKLKADIPRLEKSGLSAFEEALVAFLIAEKNTQFLQQMCRRAAQVIKALSPHPEALSAASKIEALFDQLTRPSLKVVSTRSDPEPQIDPSNTQHLIPCEICQHINDELWNFECRFQYDVSANEREQRRFLSAGGLCSFHTWQYETIASPYAICTAYPDLLNDLARRLRTAARSRQACERISSELTTARGCILCDKRSNAEAAAVSALAARLSKESVLAMKSLSAICMPHLAMLLDALSALPALVKELIGREAMLLDRVAEDMRRFTLKQDATRRYLGNQEEESAAQRGLLLVAGHRNATARVPPSNGMN